MYNSINLNNSDDKEIEDDEEEDEFDLEGDTSFGKFYSEDQSKYFGNITTIKKNKKPHFKKPTKFDQCYKKSVLLFGKDADFGRIQQIYSNCQEIIKTEKERDFKKNIINIMLKNISFFLQL